MAFLIAIRIEHGASLVSPSKYLASGQQFNLCGILVLRVPIKAFLYTILVWYYHDATHLVLLRKVYPVSFISCPLLLRNIN